MNTHMTNKKLLINTFFYASLIILSVLWLTPMLTLIFTAIKTNKDFFNGAGLFSIPKSIAWNNFSKAMMKGNLLIYMKNDLIISCLKVPLGIFIEALAAYGLTRLDIKHKTAIFIFFLIGMMLPIQVALVPINIAYTKLHLLNTYFGLFYVYLGFGISFGILILRGFFLGIPKEMDEAAELEGCSKWKIFYKIILPIAKSAIATLIITDFLATWNEYLLASVIINDNKLKTVPIGLMTFVGEHGTDYGYLCAGVLISVIPVIIVYLIFQKNFVEGMSGAVKS